MFKISIASDHRGVHIKGRLIQSLTAQGFEVHDGPGQRVGRHFAAGISVDDRVVDVLFVTVVAAGG